MDSTILDDAPDCEDCIHSYVEKDPYGTGDAWFTVTNCKLFDKLEPCPYGKE